jgi:hypothetical protein
MKYFTEFMLYAMLVIVFITGMTFGFDREMARRDYEKYKTSQQEQIVGCIFEANCNYYNDLLDKEYD